MAYTSIEADVQDNADVGELVVVSIGVTNLTSHSITVVCILSVNGLWADGGMERVLPPTFLSLDEAPPQPPGTVYDLTFIMPNENANLFIECWSENSEPWHLDTTLEKTVYLPGEGETSLMPILLIGGVALAALAFVKGK